MRGNKEPVREGGEAIPKKSDFGERGERSSG